MIRLGMLGLSEGNGHPFSFSAIVNGYDPDRLRAAGWGAISSYLDVRDPADIGFPHARVTHAWCPDPADTKALCDTANIPYAVAAPEELLADVDGVVLARDDWRSHWELARPFLDSGVPVFVDKPLSLDHQMLAAFAPHLEAGRVMSCSGYRFAPELDTLRRELTHEPPLVLQGIGPCDWERYAVHLVEPLLLLTAARPAEVLPAKAEHDAALVRLSDGSTMNVHCLGDRAPGFYLNITTAERRHEIWLQDRFTAFRRLLSHFVTMIERGEPPIDPEETMTVMRVLAAGRSD